MRYKALLPFVLLTVLAFKAASQSYIGPQIGLVSGKFAGDSPPDFVYSSKLQYSVALNFDLRLKDDLFLAFGPGYAKGGSKLQYPKEVDGEQVYEDSINLILQIVNLPLVLKIISNNKKYQFSGGFMASVPKSLIADNSVNRIEIEEQVKNIGFSMLFGIGYRIPMERSLLVIDLVYAQGLTNFANNIDNPESYLPRIRYSTFSLTTGWYLPVGKSKESP
jgi:hypothetical protein